MRGSRFRYLSALLLLFLPIHLKASDIRLIKKLLADQGFTGTMEGNVGLHQIGEIQCNASKFQVWYYTWEESGPPGLAIHAAQRLVFIQKGDRYLGSYAVDDRPARITINSLSFRYSDKSGNSIRCGRGELPTTVLLNGEILSLEK